MKTVQPKVRITASLDDFQFGIWDREAEDFIPITETNMAEMAERIGVSEVLIDSLVASSDSLKDYVRTDLVDVWKRLDRRDIDQNGRFAILEARIDALQRESRRSKGSRKGLCIRLRSG